MKLIISKFKNICAETGKTISAGEDCFFCHVTKNVYCSASSIYKDEMYKPKKPYQPEKYRRATPKTSRVPRAQDWYDQDPYI